MAMTETTAQSPANDLEAADQLLTGAGRIGAHYGLSERQVYALKENGAPIGNVPGIGLTVRVKTLDDYLEEKGVK